MTEAAEAKQNVWDRQGGAFFRARVPTDHGDLPKGIYKVFCDDDNGWMFNPHRVSVDKLVNLPDTASDEVIQEIDRFWTLEEKFSERGLIFKRGVLLYGPPGSGKTVTVQKLARAFVKAGGIVVFVDQMWQFGGLSTLRAMEPLRKVLVIVEDLEDTISKDPQSERTLLAFLDGESQIGNIVFLATTNHLDKLPPRITHRPSRFDLVKEVGMPSEAARLVYLKAKEKTLTDEEAANWAAQTDGFSIAHLRELIILCKCYDMPLDKALERLRAMVPVPEAAESPNTVTLRRAGVQRTPNTLTIALIPPDGQEADAAF